LDGRELHLGDGRHECRIAGAERRWVEDRRVEALVVRGVEPVDDLAVDVRVKDLDLDAELLGIAANALVVFGERHRAEDVDLHLAAHIHAGAMDYENSGHRALRENRNGAYSSA